MDEDAPGRGHPCHIDTFLVFGGFVKDRGHKFCEFACSLECLVSFSEPHVLLFRRPLPQPSTAQIPIASHQVAAH